MKNRFVQVYRDRISQHLLIDRLKGKVVDTQHKIYNGVPFYSGRFASLFNHRQMPKYPKTRMSRIFELIDSIDKLENQLEDPTLRKRDRANLRVWKRQKEDELKELRKTKI